MRRQYGLIAILCFFGIILIVVLIGIFNTLDNFKQSFKVGESVIADTFFYLLWLIKIVLSIAALLGSLWGAAKVYWAFFKPLNPTSEGNYPALITPRMRRVTVESGNGPVPTSYHYNNEIDYHEPKALPERSSASSQAEATIQPPSMGFIVSQLEENALQVCLGVSTTTGKPFVMDLLDGTHYRIIGSSGFGKSCEAAAIVDMTTQTNDPDHLIVALLDLEHKTSRLFENLPHIAELQVGRRSVDCVATTPDEVAEHFGYLRAELDRRKRLSEYDLRRERFMLIYVEEFLSLKREVDPTLRDQMFDDFTILALRGRKYGLYLLACAQVDYSDKSLREAASQFNVNMSFSVKPSAARAAGFASNDLLNKNFANKMRGQFVLETTGCTDIMLAPQYDVKAKLKELERPSFVNRSGSVQDPFTPPALHVVNADERPSAPRSDRSTDVLELRKKGWGKQAIIERLWSVTKGGSPRYRDAEAEYEAIIVNAPVESEA